MIPLKDNIYPKRFSLVTVFLIFINILVYLYQLTTGAMQQHFIYALGLIPHEFTNFTNMASYLQVPFPITILSSMFLHGGVFHLGGNMLYLWIFGNNVEDSMGRGRFLVFYLLCGVIAAFIHIALNPDSMIPMIGASGAISGILGAYLILFPNAKVSTLLFFGIFIKIIKVPATIIIGIWIIIQLINGTKAFGSSLSWVAWFAHIGGFLAGLILVQLFYRKSSYVH